MRSQELSEEVIFKIQFISIIRKVFNYNFKDSQLLLENSQLNDKGLKDIEIKFIDSELYISGFFEFTLTRDTKIYNKFKDMLTSYKRTDVTEFQQFFNISYSKVIFINFVNDSINYIAWREGFSIIKADFELRYITPGCHWTFENLSGDLDTVEYLKITGKRILVEPLADISQTSFTDFYKLQQNNLGIPVHNELLNEVSRQLLAGTYSSAYLIIYAAFEVATKTLISVKKPEADWLIFNMPSPSLDKLYREYINKEIGEVLSKEDLKILVEMTKNRNRIAHIGSTNVKLDYNKISRLQLIVAEWMKRINIIIGYEWLQK